MQKAAKKSRFLMEFSFEGRFDSEILLTCDGSLQDIVLRGLTAADSHHVLNKLAARFARLAEDAYSFRDLRKLEHASRVLTNLPLTRARQIGHFYQALVLKRTGQVDQAQSRFESIVDVGPLAYRARVTQALGALHFDKGQPSEALRYQLEAGQLMLSNHDPLVALLVQSELSHIQADDGDHRRALASLERLDSLVQIVAKEYPLYFYLYRNALAVEFADLGRFAEAEAACAIALASPFAAAYPEWTETRDEIAAKRQTASSSVVAIHRCHEAGIDRQSKAQREQRSFRLPIACRKANDRALVPVLLAETAEFNRNAVLIVWLFRIVLKSRGPPAFSQKSRPPISGNNVESAEGNTGLEQTEITAHWFRSKPCRLIVSRSIGVSGHSLNKLSRGPPRGRNSEAVWLIRLTAATRRCSFKGSAPQQVHNPVLSRVKINPYIQPVKIPGIRVGCCLYDLPTFGHVFTKKSRIQHARVKEAQECYGN